MADKTWNKNVRFNMNSEGAVQAWSLLHSAEVDRIVEQVTAKILANIPALAGMYLLQQQTALAAGLQNGAIMNVTSANMSTGAANDSALSATNSTTDTLHKAEENEPEENELLDFSFGM